MTSAFPAKPIGWGILGPGNVAGKFARDLRVVAGARLRMVAGRDMARTAEFAGRHGAEIAAVGTSALIEDPLVDIVYLATPHIFHHACALELLRAGKPVLVEKPMTVNATQAEELVAAARANRTFLMEAMWTRLLPAIQKASGWLAEGRIGRCRIVSSDFCDRGNLDPNLRWLNRDLAGGALLDLGVYNLALTRLFVGAAPDRIQAMAHLAPTGVDEILSATMDYPGGEMARFSCGFTAKGGNAIVISGEQGKIFIPPTFVSAQRAVLLTGGGEEVFSAPFRSGGFEFEIEEAMRCLRAGELESRLMPLDDSLATLRTMDRIREIIGVSYPGE